MGGVHTVVIVRIVGLVNLSQLMSRFLFLFILPVFLPLLPYLLDAVQWPIWAIMAPISMFLFFYMGALMLLDDVILPTLEVLIGIHATHLTRRGDRVLIAASFARSLALGVYFCIRALPFLTGLVLRLAPSYEQATFLVGAWGSILFMHELAISWRQRMIDLRRPISLLMVVAYGSFNATIFIFFVAIIACGNMLRAPEYMTFIIQHLFPVPPSIEDAHWQRFMLWTHRMQRLSDFAVMNENIALGALLTYTLWNEQWDFAILGFASMLAIMITMPGYNLWPTLPPPVIRDETGRIMNRIFLAIEDDKSQ